MFPQDKAQRGRILTAARGLFTTLGFRGTTMQSVAAAAGLSKRWLYHHFKSKEALLLAALDQMPEALLFPAEHFGGKLGEQAPDVLVKWALDAFEQEGRRRAASVVPVPPAFYEDLRLHFPETWKAIENRRQDAAKRMADMLRRLQAAGLVKAELDPDVVVAAYQTSLLTVLDPAFLIAHRVAPEKAVSTLLDLFMGGVRQQRAG